MRRWTDVLRDADYLHGRGYHWTAERAWEEGCTEVRAALAAEWTAAAMRARLPSAVEFDTVGGPFIGLVRLVVRVEVADYSRARTTIMARVEAPFVHFAEAYTARAEDVMRGGPYGRVARECDRLARSVALTMAKAAGPDGTPRFRRDGERSATWEMLVMHATPRP